MVQRTVSIEASEGSLLRGTLLEGSTDAVETQKPAVLFIHGWRSNETGYIKRAEAVQSLGYICLTFNLRGHGTSDGNLATLTLLDHLDDAVRAYGFLASQRKVDYNNIHVVGASYGGYLAAALSARKKVKSLVLRVPALYGDQDLHTPLIQDKYDKPSLHRISKEENAVLKALSGFDGRVLLIESEQDEVISHITIENYRNAIRKDMLRYELMRDTTHVLSEDANKGFIRLLVEWFQKRE